MILKWSGKRHSKMGILGAVMFEKLRKLEKEIIWQVTTGGHGSSNKS
jgi:hypothetical protein